MSVSATAVTHSAHTPMIQQYLFAIENRTKLLDLHCDLYFSPSEASSTCRVLRPHSSRSAVVRQSVVNAEKLARKLGYANSFSPARWVWRLPTCPYDVSSWAAPPP